MRTRNSAAAFAALVVLGSVVAAVALAEKPPKAKPKDFDDQQADEDSYWSQVAYPDRARYRELVQEARVLSANPQTPGNLQHAAEIFREAVALEPDEPYARYLLGDLAYLQQRNDECADQYLAIGKIDPEWKPPSEANIGPAFIAYRAGLCLALAGRIEESIPEYQRVVDAEFAAIGDVRKSYVYWALGDSYQALGRLEEAIDQYQRAIDADRDNDPMLRFALGVAYDRDDQEDDAVEAMRAALSFPSALQRLADPRVTYVPPSDEDYYHGLAFQVSYADKDGVGDRFRAITHFKRYIETVDDQTWVERARRHLTQLGATAVGTHEIYVEPADTREKDTVVKAVLAGAPELQKCLAADPYAVVRVKIVLAPPRAADKGDKGKGKGKAEPVPPTISPVDRTSLTLPGAGVPAQACILSQIKKLALPASPKSLVGVTIDLMPL